MRFVMDIHLHSSYSRATSRDLVPENLHRWSSLKGLDIVGTGDFTHPAWLQELKDKLEPAEDGLYQLRPACRIRAEDGLFESCKRDVRFALSVEISSIYKKNGRTRKIHNLVLMPSFSAVDRLNLRLEEIGNLKSDGRPILGLDSRNLVEIVMEASPDALFIPAHIWTPHFSLFGSQSGFDSFEECFEDMSPYIHAVETGLSSDPAMNSRLSALDRFSIISNSDAHSPQKLAREATCFDAELSYFSILETLRDHDRTRLTGTLEFFPEEGKYHCDGHRSCGVCWRPSETRSASGLCSACGRPVTVGVLHRVEILADRPEGEGIQRDFERLIPLSEIISSALGVGPASRRVEGVYLEMLRIHGSELKVLREVSVADLEGLGHPLVAEGIRRMRAGEVEIDPGYDGEYGRIRVFRQGEQESLSGQQAFFRDTQNRQIHRKTGVSGPNGARGNQGRGPGALLLGARGKGGKDEGETDVSLLPFGGSEGKDCRPAPDPDQAAAVEWEHGPVVVTAGPGTGKTFVLTCRIARLVREQEEPPSSILAVTFTNRAAREMQHRLRQMLPDEASSLLRIGTFHRTCREILQRFGEGNGRTVIDQAEARALIHDVLRNGRHELGLSEACDVITRAKSGATRGQAISDATIGSILTDYQECLLRHHLWDFDDLLLSAVALLENDPGVLKQVRSETRHLLVDEFQDVNLAQYRLVCLLAGDGKNLFAIGDPDQAIYGFRGADLRYFSRLCEDFPGTKSFHLQKNRRSTGQILGFAGGIISKGNPNHRSTTSTKEHGVPVRFLPQEDEISEGIAICKEIARQMGGLDLLSAGKVSGASRSFSDFAVLFRTGRQALAIEEALSTEGIPCRVIGQKGFLDAGPVRDVLAFLRFTTERDDAFRLLSALRIPLYNPGEPALDRFRGPEIGEGGLFGAVRGISRALPGRAGERVRKFVSDVDTYLEQAAREGMERGLASWCERNALAENEEVIRFLAVCGQHSTSEGMFRDVLAGQDADCERRGRGTPTAGESVSLLTLHASKGLEFPVVFIAGVEDGLIPFRDRGADLDEERRLFYVGITRGRDEVILTSAQKRRRHGLEVRMAVSPFVTGLDEGLLLVEGLQVGRRDRRRRGEQLTLF